MSHHNKMLPKYKLCALQSLLRRETVRRVRRPGGPGHPALRHHIQRRVRRHARRIQRDNLPRLCQRPGRTHCGHRGHGGTLQRAETIKSGGKVGHLMGN